MAEQEHVGDRRRANITLLEKIEATQHEILQKVNLIITAFPLDDLGRPDFDTHRRSHQKDIIDAKEADKAKREAVGHVAKVGITSGLGITLYALLDYLKAHLK